MEKSANEIKEMVKEQYSQIAEQSKEANETSCCGVGGCSDVDYTLFSQDYSKLDGYAAEADLGLGCGLPTEFAQIKEGDTVVDLGSGAGNDAFVARAITGEKGKVIGIDMTPTMIDKARENADKLGYNNVEFRLGEIENMPIGGGVADVVVSNCVLNLVPDKDKAISETFRILKPGGHFSISDMVTKEDLPEGLKNDASMYAGCVAGALDMEVYLDKIKQKGFVNITVQKERKIMLPKEILSQYMSEEEISNFPNSEVGIYSTTVYAEKPSNVSFRVKETKTCDPNSGCC